MKASSAHLKVPTVLKALFLLLALFCPSPALAAGTYEYRLRNVMSALAFPDFGAAAPSSSSTTVADQPDWHVSVFKRPAALAALDYVSIPLMAAPLCLAYNLSAPATFEVTLAGLGALLLGTSNPSAVSLTTAGSPTAVLASQVALVLAPPSASASSALLLSNLVSNGVAGFTSKTAWPAAVAANPLVVMVADEAALAQTLASRSGTMGPLPLAVGSGLPCSRVRVVTSPLTLETASYTPYLPSSTAMFHLTVSSAEPVAATSTGAAYPLVGPLVLSIRTNATCSSGADAQAFAVRVFTDVGFIASLLPWGFAPLLSDDALVATRTMILRTCGNYTRVVAGGSSAITTAVAGWVLTYLSRTLYFVDYRPDGSGTGLVGVQTGTHAIAASDALFTAAQFAQYPNIRFAPALAWAVSLVFNLDGFSTVSLPRCSLLPIFNGSITYWDDPAIQRANPAAVLPHTKIIVVARGGSSGTTEVFTGGLVELDRACNGGRNASVARSSTWKLPYQLSASSTSGIVSAVQKTVGAIGYVAAPSARAQLMAEATIVDEKTNAGTSTSNNFVQQALATSVLDPVTNELAFTASASAYPFVGVTYYVIDANRKSNCTAAKIGLQFANWTVAQSDAVTIATSATFVTLNSALVTITDGVISSVVCDSKLLFPLPTTAAEGVQSAVVAIVVIVAVACIAVALAVAVATRRTGRDLSNAPKDPSKPFAIVFTDIESSTSQWALSPIEMGPALDQHHDIMRQLIKRHRGYEVKTIGDSFMVAFKEASDAVRFGLEVQSAFYDAEWNKIFDINYRELKSVAIEEAADLMKGKSHVNLTNDLALRSQLRSENYDRLWHGLRVRVGIHYAVGEPKLDEVTQAYDYYGTVVNTAARVESVAHGGQLCVTFETLDALSSVMPTLFSDVIVTDLDEVELRGLTEPVHLFQMLPERFKDRAFPPLRLDKCDEVDTSEMTAEPSGSTATGADTASHRSSSTLDARNNVSELAKYLTRGLPETRTVMLGFAFDYTTALLSTMRPEDRKKQITTLRKNWRVTDDPRLRGFETSMGPEKFGLMLLAHRVSGTLNQKSLVVMKTEGSQGGSDMSQSNSNRFRTIRLAASANANASASMRYRVPGTYSPESRPLPEQLQVSVEDVDPLASSSGPHLTHHNTLSPSARASADDHHE